MDKRGLLYFSLVFEIESAEPNKLIILLQAYIFDLRGLLHVYITAAKSSIHHISERAADPGSPMYSSQTLRFRSFSSVDVRAVISSKQL